ncbi:MAG: response regulator transcription factor [Opitutaceae bacterium]|jgi:two-component system response regulator NreC
MKPSALTSIVIIDDHSLVRSGLKALIEKDPAFRVLGEAGNALEALQVVRDKKPAAVILDYALPGSNGVAIARMLLAERPDLKILMVTGSLDMSFISEAVRMGVLGCVRKESNSAELLEALHGVARGEVRLCPDAAAALAQSVRSAASSGGNDPNALSEREQQVLKWVAKGLRNKEIADKLGVSIKSVETYRSRLMRKIGCGSTADLMRHAISLGL